MDFTGTTERLSQRMQEKLPGREAQLAMSSLRRIREMETMTDHSGAKESGVLVLLYPGNDDICTVMIQRPSYPGVHGGQISFPGGKREAHDRDLIDTALRESREEIGISAENLHILGTLTSLYIPPSNYIVLPVVAIQHEVPSFSPDLSEVEEIIELPLSKLLLPETKQYRRVSVGDWSATVPCFYLEDRLIWGATAMILNELLEIISADPSLRW